jgi:hypothetical protein
MKRVVALLLLLCAFPFVASGADVLNLKLRMTTGERSRDSNSMTTSITVSGGTIVYNVSYGGRNRGREPEQKEFKLEKADQKRLIELIKAKNLLVTKSVERTVDDSGPSYYFELSLSTETNGSKGLISIKGPRKAPDIKDSDLYKNTIALVDAIYEIIHRTDEKIDYEPLIH